MVDIDIEIQNPEDFDNIPNQEDLQCWVVAALQEDFKPAKNLSLVIRFVDEDEGSDLNHTYRLKQEEGKKATNILSFPNVQEDFGIQEVSGFNQQDGYLGDLVLCEPIIRLEAEQQKKKLRNHWAHLVIHGTLHLQDYDHLEEGEALKMEALEIQILNSLGFGNPY